MFSCLFRQPEYLRELYLVLHPEDAGVKTKDIRIITLENVLTNGEHNDLGFLVRDTLMILVEAQTTFSVNLGLRLLLYVAETYRRLADERGWDVYSSRALEVPRPELVVIYAGSARNVPDKLRVSVVYKEEKEGAAKPEKTEDVLDAGIKILDLCGENGSIRPVCDGQSVGCALLGRFKRKVRTCFSFHGRIQEGKTEISTAC